MGFTHAVGAVPVKIVKIREAETPPPGAGFATVTLAVPAAERSLAGMVAVNWPALCHDVESAVPFHCTTAPFSKFEPNATKLSEELPAAASDGEMAPTTGMSWGGDELPCEPPPQPVDNKNKRTPTDKDARQNTVCIRSPPPRARAEAVRSLNPGAPPSN